MADQSSFWSPHRGGLRAAKIYPRIFSLVCTIVVIALSAAVSVINSRSTSIKYHVLFPWWSSIVPVIVGVIFDATELALVKSKNRNPGAHPGWHVGVELLLTGGGITVAIFIASQIPVPRYSLIYNFPDSFVPLSTALAVFLGLFTGLRFYLFVIACIETDRRRKAQALQRQKEQEAAKKRDSIHSETNWTYHEQADARLERPETALSSQTPNTKYESYPESPEDQKFLGGPSP
ncbi:hypothetical protein F4861DRAFT_308847 [Xylaria intraflava]|nr:hypothetical protein F4861DRAFT_308847 [Xylaria intraflava]